MTAEGDKAAAVAMALAQASTMAALGSVADQSSFDVADHFGMSAVAVAVTVAVAGEGLGTFLSISCRTETREGLALLFLLFRCKR